jgi:hypothetical protein
MAHLPSDAPPEFGKGAIQDPPDPRDLRIAADSPALAAEFPATFRIGNRPPVTNQGLTPECVPYSAGVEQNWQDRVEHGRFFNFDEHAQFVAIGGTANGSVMRYCLDRMRNVGFPEQDSTPSAGLHKIDGYANVELSVQAIKAAIPAFGGVLVIGPWWPNWEHPLGPSAVLPPPDGGAGGHAWWGIGWDENGLIGQNSWGTLWGDGGLFRMPWQYVVDRMWDVWTTVDDRTLSIIAKAQIKELRTYLRRPSLVIGDGKPKLGPTSIWGQARRAGIWRRSTDAIVATPWDKPFRYLGKRNGVRHSEGPRGETWALLGIAGNEVAIPITAVRLVNA